MNTTTKAKPHAGLSFALDFGPLLAFFIAYKFTGIFMGTAVFMAAIVVALVVSVIVLKRVSPMTWISAILVVGFGGLTIYLNDPSFIQLKPRSEERTSELQSLMRNSYDVFCLKNKHHKTK